MLLQESMTEALGIANELNRESGTQCNIQSNGVVYMRSVWNNLAAFFAMSIDLKKVKTRCLYFLMYLFKDLYICDLTLL